MSPQPRTPAEHDRLRDVNWFVYVPRHWLETRTARRLQTPRARVVLLVATIVLAALYAVALAVDDPGGTFFGALVLFLVVSSLALLAGGPTVCAPPDRLDERELEVRGRVMGLSFIATSAALALVILVVTVLARPIVAGADDAVDADRLPMLMMAPVLFGLLVHSVVPIAVLTWFERDRRPDPELPPLGEDPVATAGTAPDAPFDRTDAAPAPASAGPRRVAPDDPAARRAIAQARPAATATPEDPTATIAPDGAGLPVTHDFPVVEEPPGPPPRATPD